MSERSIGVSVDRYNEIAPQEGFTPKYLAVVISLHGMLTAGRWQKKINLALGDEWMQHFPFDYGFRSFGVLRPKKLIDSCIETFNSVYIRARERAPRVCVIAHSFGTKFTGHALQTNPGMTFENIILTGSVLPVDFNWKELHDNGQIVRVLNEYCEDDDVGLITWLGGRLGWEFGPSGRKGFSEDSDPYVNNVHYRSKSHTRCLDELHARTKWTPFLLDKV